MPESSRDQKIVHVCFGFQSFHQVAFESIAVIRYNPHNRPNDK